MKTLKKELKAEDLESRTAPISIATTDPIVDAPVDHGNSAGGDEPTSPPCFSPKATGTRGPLIYVPE